MGSIEGWRMQFIANQLYIRDRPISCERAIEENSIVVVEISRSWTERCCVWVNTACTLLIYVLCFATVTSWIWVTILIFTLNWGWVWRMWISAPEHYRHVHHRKGSCITKSKLLFICLDLPWDSRVDRIMLLVIFLTMCLFRKRSDYYWIYLVLLMVIVEGSDFSFISVLFSSSSCDYSC